MIEDTLIRATEAKHILEHELYKSAFEDTRNKIIQQIESCDLKDDVLRDKLMLSLQLLKRLQRVLNDHIDTGKLAEKRMEQRTVFNRQGL